MAGTHLERLNSDALNTAELISAESRASATPMMEQYIEIKANNPDSLLFYRMGDFYELFFEDAVEASRALGITLTKRGQHMGVDIPMCGVPIHAADDYLQKLISLGFRVAVCEQVEDPAEARKRGSKSVVKRDVVRLVTPGTLTEEKLLSPSESNYLMALARIRGGAEAQMALAWIDISTGVFRMAETTPLRLLADILRIEPRELIVPDTVFHDPDLKGTFDILGRIAVPQPGVLFDSATAESRITRYFGVGTLDGFGTFSRAELGGRRGRRRLRGKDADRRTPAAECPGARKRRLDAVHRSGNTRQSGTHPHAVGASRRFAAEGDRPHRHRRRRTPARRAADVAAHRSGEH